MVLSVPWEYSIDIIDLKPVEELGINPMGVSDPWTSYLVNISLRRVRILLGINPMGGSAPWADTLEIIALDPINNNL